MRTRTIAIAFAASIAMTSAPVMVQPAYAQNTMSNAVATGLPIALWAITGAVLGAVAWPVITGGTAAAAPINNVGAFMNAGAAVGTVVGGVGYYLTR